MNPLPYTEGDRLWNDDLGLAAVETVSQKLVTVRFRSGGPPLRMGHAHAIALFRCMRPDEVAPATDPPGRRTRRITLRLSPTELEQIARAARVAGVETGGLVREVTLRWCAFWAAERCASRVNGEPVPMRRRTGS